MQIILNIEGIQLKLKNSAGMTARMIAGDPLVRRLLDAMDNVTNQKKPAYTHKIDLEQSLNISDGNEQAVEVASEILEIQLKKELESQLKTKGRTRAQRIVHVPIMNHFYQEDGDNILEERKEEDLLDITVSTTKRITTQPVSMGPTGPLTKQSSQYGEVKSTRMQEQGGKKETPGVS